MARAVFRMTCLLLALAVQLGVQTATPTPETDQTWKKTVLGELREIKEALSEGRSSHVGGFGKVVAQVVAEQTPIVASGSAVSSTTTDLQSTQLKLQKYEERLQAIQKELQELKMDQDKNIIRFLNNSGSTFVRWGRKTCPANTTLVYSGVAGGKQWNEKGGGTNSLCLTRSPEFDNTTVSKGYGHLYGGEYQRVPGHHDHNVPCSVCRAPQSTTIMTAGTHTCPPGWTAQYTGHLTSAYWKNDYATEYMCLDDNPENDDSGEPKDEDGLTFYYTVTVCGSLPCPPYQNGKVVTCVVCSM